MVLNSRRDLIYITSRVLFVMSACRFGTRMETEEHAAFLHGGRSDVQDLIFTF